jgi:hypothetical protein
MRIPHPRKLRTLGDGIGLEPLLHILRRAPERACDLVETLARAGELLRPNELFERPRIVVGRTARAKGLGWSSLALSAASRRRAHRRAGFGFNAA